MKYFSLDLETTGLDPERDQILEIGIVYDDLEKPWSERGVWNCLIQHERISGDPYALAMNASILDMISGRVRSTSLIMSPSEASQGLVEWVRGYAPDGKITLAGKNVASFDWPFLKRFGAPFNVRHRMIDPAMFYMRADDAEVPNLQTCLIRAGLPDAVEHRAVADAEQVCRLIRRHYGLEVE